MADKRKYVPLNVKTYREGFLRLQGWTVFSCIAFFTAGLLVLYELLVINVEDQDFRDMLFDYRITSPGIDHQHKHFVAGHYCCHQDTAVYSYSCPRPPSNFSAYWGSDSPPCPPTVQFTCPDLTSSSCNKMRAAVYPAAGLDASSGHAANCSRAGRVLLRARAGSGYRLTANVHGSQLSQQLVLDPHSIDTGQVDAFVAQVAAAHGDPMFLLPSEPLGRSLRLGGALVPLQPQLADPSGDKFGEFGWPWELWPWPPSAACSNTGTPASLRLEGSIKAHFAAFDPSKPLPHFPVAFLGSALSVPQYQRLLLPAQQQQQQQQGAGAGAVAWTAGAAGADVDGNATVVVSALTGINMSVGLLPQLGACRAWQLHRPGLSLEYGRELWRGSVAELAAVRKPITAGSQINVQRNRGLPIFLYRYMRKYRGW